MNIAFKNIKVFNSMDRRGCWLPFDKQNEFMLTKKEAADSGHHEEGSEVKRMIYLANIHR
jgi:predicted RNA-binding protein (virulence factor B family)